MSRDCDATRRALLLEMYGEAGEAARRDAERHLLACESCRIASAEERRLEALLGVREEIEPSDDLLLRCRRGLSAALDAGDAPRAAAFDSLAAAWRQIRLSPAYGFVMLTAGFLAGFASLRAGAVTRPEATRVEDRAAQAAGPATEDAGRVAAASVLGLESVGDLGHVRVSLDTVQRGSVEGTAADPAIRDLLVRTVRESGNAGLRLEAIEALRHQTDQEDVRQVLLRALSADDNAGARLKAIDALDARAPSDAEVRGAILTAVERDSNPGVRVRAMDVLSRVRDPRLVPDMERLSREDPDTYIRMRSGAFVDAMYARDGR